MSEAKIQIPEHLKPFIEIEHCDDFNMDRYYLTDNLDYIFKDILRTRRIAEEMQKMNIDYMNTTLLYGITGTGKTTFGRYVAYKLDMDFAYINYAKVVGGVLGNTSRNISDIFRFMADTECVFMMDEIDCISQKRGTEGAATGGELSRITITIMQELDYYKKKKVKSIILGATNRKDTMDTALLSRFSIQHEFKNLTLPEKKIFIDMYLKSVGIEYDPQNIDDYCAKYITLTQRNIEADMIRCIAQWIDNGKKNYQLTRTEE